MKLFKIFAIFLLVIGFSGVANAELSIKEKKWKNTVEPKISSSLKKFKEHCGYDVKLDIKWNTMKTADHSRRFKSMATVLEEVGEKLCKEFKKEMAAGFKTAELEIGSKTSHEFDKGTKTLKLVSDGSSVPSIPQIKKLLEEDL